MTGFTTIGRILNAESPASGKDLIGHTLAAVNATPGAAGSTTAEIRQLIEASDHHIPSNIAGRLLDLKKKGLVTSRKNGSEMRWRLTPQGRKRYPAPQAAVVGVPAEYTYINIESAPDFYRELVSQINKAYYCGLYVVVPILARKLLENLLIDVLRRRFGMKDADLFYDKRRRRFHDFGQLLVSLEGCLAELHPVSSSFNRALVRRLDAFRETGNSRAHSIEVQTSQNDVDEARGELENLTRLLLRAYEHSSHSQP